MKSISGLWAVCFAVVLLTTGCDQIPGLGPDTLIVDLGAVAKATGQEEAMQTKAQSAREDLNARLVESAQNLEKQIREERDKAGDSPTQEQEVQLQQMALQAQQQYSRIQADAQQQAQQFENNLVLEFREQVKPFAEKMARSHGASVILLADQSVFWLEPTIDMTDELIAELLEGHIFSDTGAGQTPVEPAAVEPTADQPAIDK